MGMKSQQSKGRNPCKTTRQQAGSTDPPAAADADCSHYTRGSDELNRILSHVRSSDENAASCEHCRGEPARRGNKEKGGKDKGKQQKKKGGAKSEIGLMWVCLDCQRCFCGGEVQDTEPYGHVRRHSKQDHHPWAVRFGDPLIYWCFKCNKPVPSGKVDRMVEEVKIKPSDVNDGGRGGERKVNDYIVNDSQELLRILLDRLSTEETSYRKAATEKDKACSGVTFVDVIFGELEKRIKAMQTLIQEEDDDASFTQRAEMYYQKRPQLMENMEELRKAYSTQALSRSSLLEKLEKSPSEDLENKISTDEMSEDSWMASTSELNRLVEENWKLLLEMTRSNEERRELAGLVEKLMREKETLLEQQSKLMDENWALSHMLQKLPNATTSQLARLKTLIHTKLGGD